MTRGAIYAEEPPPPDERYHGLVPPVQTSRLRMNPPTLAGGARRAATPARGGVPDAALSSRPAGVQPGYRYPDSASLACTDIYCAMSSYHVLVCQDVNILYLHRIRDFHPELVRFEFQGQNFKESWTWGDYTQYHINTNQHHSRIGGGGGGGGERPGQEGATTSRDVQPASSSQGQERR